MYDRVVRAWRFLLCFLAFFAKGRELRKAKRRLPLTVCCQSAHERSAFVFLSIKRCNANSACDWSSVLSAIVLQSHSFICVWEHRENIHLSRSLMICDCLRIAPFNNHFPLSRWHQTLWRTSHYMCSFDIQSDHVKHMSISLRGWCAGCHANMHLFSPPARCVFLPRHAVRWQRWKSFRSWGTDPRTKTEWRPSTAAPCVRHLIVLIHHALLLTLTVLFFCSGRLKHSHHLPSSAALHTCTVLVLLWPIQWPWHS